MRKIKDYILKKLGILKLRESDFIVQNKIKELESKNCKLTYENVKLVEKVNDIEKLMYRYCCGLNQNIRDIKLIVSVTTFPDRINYVHIVLERMLTQTFKADEIILWLSQEQFPQREKELPEKLLKLKEYGVKIEWCEGDIKSYKKILPVLNKYPNDLIVTIDDDLLYPIDLLEKLYEGHKKFPNAIVASRVHEIKKDQNGKIAPYKTWEKECLYDVYQIREDWFYTSGAGTLFPPKLFTKDVFDLNVIENYCPWADDVWLNIHSAINRIPVVNIAANARVRRIEGTQVVCLVDINVEKGQNDVQLQQLAQYYKDKLVGTLYENM